MARTGVRESPITLAVSIVVYDTEVTELQALLRSLLFALKTVAAANLSVRTEISLVDNSDDRRLDSADYSGLEQQLDACHTTLQLTAGHGNIGFGRGHNLVLRASAADYHLILNPDVELASDSLAVGLVYLEQHSDVALVSPYAESASGEKQYLCKRYPSLLVLFARGFLPGWARRPFKGHLAHYEIRDLSEDEPQSDVPLVSGCCMLGRGSQLRSIGGFDERYFLYFEDFDLSLRLGKNARIVYLPGMRIRHFGGYAAGKGRQHIAMYCRSAWRFFNTWGWRVT